MAAAATEPRFEVGPEFFPEVAREASEQAVRAAPRSLAWGRHARRKPRVLDHVVDDVAGEASPRESEFTVGSRSEDDRLDGVGEAATRRRPAGRAKISRVLS